MRRLCFASITASRQVIKADNFGLERPLDMIEMGKYSAFVGPVCNKDYQDELSSSWCKIASEIKIYFSLCSASVAASWQVIKSDKFSLKRPLEVIETGKHSAFEGPMCNKRYHDAPSISCYCIGNEFAYRTNIGLSKQLDSYFTKLLSIRLKT